METQNAIIAILHACLFVTRYPAIVIAAALGQAPISARPATIEQLSKGGGLCNTNLDCHLNGECDHGACRCDTAWTGTTCATLHLLPTPPGFTNGRAYPSTPNTSSWGGNVLEVNGSHHMYVSEMARHCGLASWQHNSFIRHAVSTSGPEGPYTPHEVVEAAFSHNAQAILTPDGQTIAVFHVGNGESNGKKKLITNCTNGTTPLPVDRRSTVLGVQPNTQSNGIWTAVPTSHSPGGPWKQRNVTCVGGCKGLSNPSPWVLANGTALVAWRMGADAEKGKGKWSLSLASAPSLFGPYSPLSGNWSVPVFVPNSNCEDPFLWVDKRGGFHIMNHCYHNGDRGGHAFSTDGYQWSQSRIPPWTDTVQHTDGTSTQYYMRQRPKLLFSRSGDITHLLTGLPLQSRNRPPEWQRWCTGHSMVTPSCDLTETHIQAVNT